MAIAFIPANSRMPGLNFEGPPSIKDLEFVFDDTFAEEQRNRLQLLMGQYRAGGPSYGVVDESNPNSATPGSGRPLCIQPNAGNPLTVDVLPGFAVTKAGNIIVLTEQLFGLRLADESVTTSTVAGGTNVVLLEYLVVDDEDTNVVTDYSISEAVRRVVAPTYDTDSTVPQLIKIVTLSDYLDPSKFSSQRLNEVVVLAVVRTVQIATPASTTVQSSSPPLTSALSIDMTNAVNTYVRPWFSAVDQEHRKSVGTGTITSTNPHGTSLNEMSQGSLTLLQQLVQHGMIISRDLDVPGCPGKYCTELVDTVRVLTDTDGTVTGTSDRRYVRLNSYPTRLIGARENMLDGLDVVEDTSLGARPIAVEVIPNTNILAFHRNSGTDEAIDSSKGFTVYYTDVDCLRPPALPREVMLVANDIIQLQQPNTDIELLVTGGKEYSELPSNQFTVGTNGPIPKIYQLWMDGDQQYVQSPQVIQCAVLLTDPPGVGVAIQEPQFAMYGPARIRAALWNATSPAPSNLDVRVEIAGKDVDGVPVTEVLIFNGTALSAQPREITWDQPLPVDITNPNMDFAALFQVSTTVFSSIDTWKIKDPPVAAGANALVQLWAELEPTTTPALNDALPICKFWWNGQSVSQVRDTRPISRKLTDTEQITKEQMNMMSMILGISTTGNVIPMVAESFKDPRFQDNILSKRVRNHDVLDTVFTDEELTVFNTDGKHSGREWYYSQAISLPASLDTLYMVVFGDSSNMFNEVFGDDAYVEYQLFSSPLTDGDWTIMPPVGTARLRRLTDLTSEFKIRFRIVGKRLSGYALVLKTS